MQKTSFITYFRTFFRVLEFYIFDYFEKQSILKNFSQTKIHKLISNGVVLDGPFKGMKYPKNESFGSAFLPKILGTYEKEISSLVQSLLNSNYDIVLDVGCAEGYYAVGFAKFGKAKKVFAYDIQEKARKLCSDMALANNVAGKLKVQGLFDINEYLRILKEFPNSKILLILDTEGFEKILLNQEFRKILEKTDFLIEMHDFIDTEITDIVSEFFDKKEITKIFSLSDFQKGLEYQSEFLLDLDFKTKYYVLAEGRPEQMKWYFVRE